MIQVPKNSIVKAKFVEGWNFSIFGRPKLSIVCGSCGGEFKTREYRDFFENKQHIDSIACCCFCGKWNRLGVTYA